MWYNLFNSAQTAQEKRKGYSMKIVLVGGGKVGTALARQLSEEGHNVTVIDTNKARVEHIGESYDVMSIFGNGSRWEISLAAAISGLMMAEMPICFLIKSSSWL